MLKLSRINILHVAANDFLIIILHVLIRIVFIVSSTYK